MLVLKGIFGGSPEITLQNGNNPKIFLGDGDSNRSEPRTAIRDFQGCAILRVSFQHGCFTMSGILSSGFSGTDGRSLVVKISGAVALFTFVVASKFGTAQLLRAMSGSWSKNQMSRKDSVLGVNCLSLLESF